MFGKLAAFIVMCVTATLFCVAPANADSYGNTVSTTCIVRVTATPGKALSARIVVQGNSTDPVKGTVTVQAFHASRQVWSRSVAYSGTAVTFGGPTLPAGSYRAVGAFKPTAGGVYSGTRCTDSFRTRGVAAEHTGPGGHNGAGTGVGPNGADPSALAASGLPNTGGPAEWWLFLGIGLLLAGAASVVAGRRRATA